MSADNGIYILRTNLPPTKIESGYKNNHNKYEYRVAYCSAIDNIDYSDLYLPLLFGDSKIFNTIEESSNEAEKIYRVVGGTEYGIQHIHLDKYFPNMTRSAAEKALDCYIGSIPLDYKE